MNSIKNTVLQVISGLTIAGALTGCSKASYKKTKGGMPYQVFASKDTQRIRTGNYIKIQYTQKIKDSVYFTTVGAIPQYQQVNEQQFPYDISELWTSLKLGDSVIATQMIDTFIARRPADIPKEFKKGDKIVHYIKVLAIFTSDTAARADFEKTNKQWLASEIKVIEQYLAEKKITAQKTPSGAYVEILEPGTGALIDSGKYVSVNYTGVSWSGKKFDSNTDTAFKHVGPYPFLAGTGAMIKGFDEAVQFMRLGGKAKAYIPSVLAYGGQPQSPLIKPYEHLIFDIEVVDVKDKMPPPPTRQDLPPQMQRGEAPQQNN